MRRAYRVLLSVCVVLAGYSQLALAQPATTLPDGPVFIFPSNGQTFPYSGALLFQARALPGARDYLWSFLQNGAIVWENLAFDATLSSNQYSITPSSRAHRHLHPGQLQVWVRAQLANGTWTRAGVLRVYLQGSGTAPVPHPTPVPTHPAPGTVLYQADTSGGLDKWTGPSDWKHLNGMLVDDGSSGNGIVYAPYQLGKITNYVVEAEIQMVSNGIGNGFGPFVRAVNGDGYTAGVELPYSSAFLAAGPIGYRGGGSFGQEFNRHDYTGDANWHIYRLEVQGESIRFLVDGSIMDQATDIRFLSPGQIGLWDSVTQINVRSFKVIAL